MCYNNYEVIYIKKLVQSVRCKLQVEYNSDVYNALKDTVHKFADACNYTLDIAYIKGIHNQFKIHHESYMEIRDRFGLTANLAVRAIARVAQAMKSTRKKKSCPRHFKATSVDYDQRIFSLDVNSWTVSLSTINGRLHIPLAIGNYQRHLLLDQKPTFATLYFNKRNKTFYLDISIKNDVPDPDDLANSDSKIVGVDRGIYNIVATTNNIKISGKEIQHTRRRFKHLRARLQAKGTKSAKRALQRLSGKEQRWMKYVNHCISKLLVNSLNPGDTLVFEDLANIRERIKSYRKQTNFQISNWAFYQLEQFVEYKALAKGVKVVYIDPKYTSQRCSICGHISKTNRDKHSFRCEQCGHVANADTNAAYNIRSAHLAITNGLSSTSPKVASSLSYKLPALAGGS